jgi:hypothetical protein
MFTLEESTLLSRMLRVLWWAAVALSLGGACYFGIRYI